MELCLPRNLPACQDRSTSGESSTTPSNSTNNSLEDLSMNDLKICLTEFLSIETSTIGFNQSPGDNNTCNVVRTNECKDSDKKQSSSSAAEKCSGNRVTYPAVDQCHSQPLSLSIPLKLVPAMKGSREKQGIPPKNCSVTWAPDVYDPIPTSVSHVPSIKNHRYRNDGKRYGKKKQKGSGKSPRGCKGKDVKQARKNGDSSTIGIKPLRDESVVVGVAGYNDATSDAFCGSTFLKKSIAGMHFPVTEAT